MFDRSTHCASHALIAAKSPAWNISPHKNENALVQQRMYFLVFCFLFVTDV